MELEPCYFFSEVDHRTKRVVWTEADGGARIYEPDKVQNQWTLVITDGGEKFYCNSLANVVAKLKELFPDLMFVFGA